MIFSRSLFTFYKASSSVLSVAPRVGAWIETFRLPVHVDKNGKIVPFLEILSDLVKKNIEIRLLHAKEPGPVFRKDFDRYPNLISGMERILCPRVHLKSVIIDGKVAYTGSANLTGAGMGAKSSNKRNFEAGIITTEANLVSKIIEQFAARAPAEYHCRFPMRNPSCDLRCLPSWSFDHREKYAWLGTGDASLRDAKVLSQFERHYRQLLKSVHTLSLPHHGSRYNTGPQLMEAVDPRIAVTACQQSDPSHPSRSDLKCALN